MAKKKNSTTAEQLQPPINQTALAAAVAKAVKLQSIRLVGCHAQLHPLDEDIYKTLQVKFKTSTAKNQDGLIVSIELALNTKGKGDAKSFELNCDFLLAYELTSDEEFNQEHLDAFGALNGMFNVWPYAREFTQSMSLRMGLPPLTMPLFRPLSNDVKAVAERAPGAPKQIGLATKVAKRRVTKKTS